MQRLQKLTDLGSEAIRVEAPDLPLLRSVYGDFAAEQLTAILAKKNGFYAFESALHVLPDIGAPPELGLHEWNETTLWRADYAGMADATVFFAEDIFGKQFCIRERAIGTFEPETGEFEVVAASMEEWAEKILEDYSYWTGHTSARDWQLRYGRLPFGARLVPTMPFVLGGRYDSENLKAMDAVEGMRFRASIATQILDLPDGMQIELKVTD